MTAWFFCSYSIDRKSNLERHFSIDEQTGVIATARPLDRESRAVHNLSVVATERGESVRARVHVHLDWHGGVNVCASCSSPLLFSNLLPGSGASGPEPDGEGPGSDLRERRQR